MKILVVIPSWPKVNGVDYHRMMEQHRFIGLMNEDVIIDVINQIDTAEVPFLSQFDLVIVNRFLSKTGENFALIQKLNKARVKYVLDLDDDYVLPTWHILYGTAKANEHAYKIIEAIKGSHAITTPQDKLGATINAEICKKKYAVIPNGINPVNQFEVIPTDFDKVHIGWSGSVTHFEDVLLLHDALSQLYLSDLKDSFRMVQGGYDGTDLTSSAIAGILSARGTAPSDSFITYPVADVLNYATFYDNIDVSLIPLRDNRFNNMKSNLKMLEAGFKKKAVVVSDVHPYSPLIENGWNCLAVRHKNDWYKNIKKLIESPSMREDLSEQLYEDVQDYHIERVADLRYKFYKSLI